ncbi:MAG: lipase secretion chaperone [Desulfobacteraceae bacterium]|nr:lipase secretion chaperone [Desulfobacteraceae bacterium]
MSNRAAVILAVVIALSFTVVLAMHRHKSLVAQYNKENHVERHIIDKRYKIVLQDSKLDYKQEDFSDEKIKEYFSKGVIDAHTYNFLQHLDELFSDLAEGEDPFNKVRQYLNARLPADQAKKMFELYSLYVDYQMNLQQRLKDQGLPASPQEALEDLADLQDYRRAVFGQENADMIFGASVEAQEFQIRRNAILYNDALYGAQKEEQLKALGKDMWGAELSAPDAGAAYSRYQEKLQLYKKDLSEMRTEEERRAFLEHLNLESFDPVQRQALEEAKQATAEENRLKEAYFAKEKEIRNDLYITEHERAQKIKELQDATFGDQADAFRRREAMRTAPAQTNQVKK